MNDCECVKKIIFYKKIFEVLKFDRFQDRLGRFVTIELDESIPNERYVKAKTIKIISNLYELLGYQPFTLDELREFSEVNESWIIVDRNYQIHINHKYWSLEKCEQFRDHFKVLAKYNDFEVETI